jgi:RHS repeat-associated protein
VTGKPQTPSDGASFTVNDENQLTSAPGVSLQSFDANGNLVHRVRHPSDYGYAYDAENQLINWYYYDGGYNGEGQPTSSEDLRIEFVYDGLRRLRRKVEYNVSVFGTWSSIAETRYIYDGRRVIQERNGFNNTPTVGYTRGTDLSGSLEGAGGIGGMLARSHGYSSGNWSTHNFYHADAGGNITYMINGGQSMVASYRYDPYGNTISSSGSLAGANVYRFSSKEIHGYTGMYYYGYRWYDPNLQRWLNRDPIHERGGYNLYQSVLNAPPNYVDPDGRLLPVLYAIFEIGSTAYDLCDTVSTLADDHATSGDKLISVVGTAAGIPAPGPGGAYIKPVLKKVFKKAEPRQLARGKRAHREEPVLPGEKAEVTTPSGKRRMDRYNEETAHIREIKPDNPREIKRGEKQLEGYKKEMECETGRSHTTEVTPYDPSKYE